MVNKNSEVSILIIDDQRESQRACALDCRMIFSNVSDKQLSIVSVSSIEEAKKELLEQKFHIIFLDKDLGPDKNSNSVCGVDHIQELLSIQPFVQILVLTADPSYKDIARAIRLGASDYLLKSLDSELIEYRSAVIETCLRDAKESLKRAQNSRRKKDSLYSNYVCISPSMQRLEKKLEALAESNRPVLILGDSGLGKGAVARRLNCMRKRHLEHKDRPFVNLNIAATSDELAQSELFGQEPHSFTGAGNKVKPGHLDVARDGDIFLDEIGDCSPEMQLKLLKVVEENQYMRVGGRSSIKTNARFIFATNKDLAQMVKEGKFRHDLYMRISAFEIELPTLKDRKEDLPDIIEGILNGVLKEYPYKKMKFQEFPNDLIRHITRDDVPGNIRGIENEIARLVAHLPTDSKGRPNYSSWREALGIKYLKPSNRKSTEVLEVKHLKELETNFISEDFPGLKKIKDLVEEKILEEAAKKYASMSLAARKLKISKSTMSVKLKAKNISMKEDHYG